MSTIHLRNWVDWSNPDYYTMFVKAWIPFNAWFMDSFYDGIANFCLVRRNDFYNLSFEDIHTRLKQLSQWYPELGVHDWK